MNIEQLAIEHGILAKVESLGKYAKHPYMVKERQGKVSKLEAFAKAYAQQQSEPVAWCIDDGFTKKILNKTPSDEDIATAKRFNWLAYPLYTQPPNTVSLEQYNKLFGKVAELEADLLACSNENIALRDAIAEAEGK